MTEPEWIALLEALDTDRDRAAEKYETLRAGLIAMFRSRGLWKDAEELADETVDRSARRLVEKASTDEPILNIVSYMQGVAGRVARESYRRPRPVSLADAPEPNVHPDVLGGNEAGADARALDCLLGLLDQLPRWQRTIIIEYYRFAKSEKIASRADLAREGDKSKGALRVQAFRIRRALREKLMKLIGAGGKS